MKKTISLVLVAAILFGFLGMIAFSVFGESYVVRMFIDTPAFQVGDTITTDFSLDAGNGNRVESMTWLDQSYQPVSGVFEENKVYYLQLQIVAEGGFFYDEDMLFVRVNDGENECSPDVSDDEKQVLVTVEFNFNPTQVKNFQVWQMPEFIEPGKAVLPEGLVVEGPVVLTGLSWVDADKKPVAEFEDGKLYYLQVNVVPVDGYEFRNWAEIYGNLGDAQDYEIVSKTELQAWFPYSLEPGVGDIQMTVTGLEPGKPMYELQFDLGTDAKVELKRYEVSEYWAPFPFEDGAFEDDYVYFISYYLHAVDGYDLRKYGGISIIDEDDLDCGIHDGYLVIHQTFSTCEPVGTVKLQSSGVEVGKPFAGVQLEVLENEHVYVSNVQVQDLDANEWLADGCFESGHNYEINYHIDIEQGYYYGDGIEVLLDGEPVDFESYGTDTIVISQRFSTWQWIDYVELALSQMPEPGVNVEDVTVSGNDENYTISYAWVEENQKDAPTGAFREDSGYCLEIELTAKEGFRFQENLKIQVEGMDSWNSWNDGAQMGLELCFDFHGEPIYSCWLNGLPWGIEPGAAPEVTPVPEEDGVVVSGVQWVDKDKKPVTTLEDGKVYYLEVTLEAAPGYAFDTDLGIYSDYSFSWESQQVSSAQAKAWFKYSLEPGVGDIHLTVTGLEVGKPVSGLQATLADGANVELQGVQVYDVLADQMLEDGVFADKSRYYITYILTPKDGYNIEDCGDVTINGQYDFNCEWSGDAMWLRQIFSTCEPLGTVKLESSGLEVGKPIADVQLQILEGKGVSFDRIEVLDYMTGEPVREDTFEKGRYYWVRYILRLEEGYSPEDGYEISLNGNEDLEVGYDSWFMEVFELFNTCEVLNTVELTLQEPEVGASIDDCKVVCGSEQYTVAYYWFDESTGNHVEGTFQKGKAYQIGINVYPAEGYALSQDVQVFLNGELLDNGYTDNAGANAFRWKKYSFREKITRLDLPAMPKSIAMGDSLSAQLTVPEGAHYSIQAQWLWQGLDGLKPVQKVDKDGVYLLKMQLTPQEGYEFDADMQVFADGKLFISHSGVDTFMQAFKSYSVGMKLIDRVDITVAEPQVGATPQKPVFAEDANYVLTRDWCWMSGEKDNLNQAELTETFAAGTYNYLYMILFAKEGYAFSEDVQFYVNGKKMPLAINLDMGFALQTGVSFGKLQEEGSVGTGDLDGLVGITVDDAIYLLQHVLMPGLFPVESDADFDGSGAVTVDDAIYLLQHVLMPGLFPLK